jgi:hypothetical protein
MLMTKSTQPGRCTPGDLRWEFKSGDHSSGRGVHTFDIVKQPDGDGYFGYAGPLISGGRVELWVSSDLYEWRPHPERVVFQHPGARWPTVVREGGSVFMIVRQAPSSVDFVLDWVYHRSDEIGMRIPRKLFRYVGKARLDIYESKDGVQFEKVGSFCRPNTTGRKKHKNPFLFEHPEGGVGLVYFSRSNSLFQIRYRHADTVRQLRVSSDTVLLSSDSLVAAPSIYYDEATGVYSLLAEEMNRERNVWLTTMYTVDNLRDGADPESRHVLFESNVACPFPYWDNDDSLLFVSHCTTGLNRSVDETDWQGLVYDIEK